MKKSKRSNRLKSWAARKLGLVTTAQHRKSLGELKAKFDSAQTTDSNTRHWANSDSLTADQAASSGVRQTLRNRARYEVANNSYARGMLLTYADDLIGPGPGLDIQTSSSGFNEGVERRWKEWAEEIQLARKLRLASVAKKQDGEAFLQMFTNPKLRSPVKLDIRLIEADRIEDPSMGTSQDENTLDGIKYDAYGNPVSYQVANQPINPTFSSWTWKYDTVPARWMIHWFREDRPGQHRGLPEIMPALPLFADQRRYSQAVIGAAESAADFNILLTNTQATPDDEDLLDPMDSIEIEHDMMTALPAGYDGRQMRAEQPTTHYVDYKNSNINEVGRCINMPFNIAALNSAGYNFASGRLDHMAYDRTLEVERDDCRLVVLERVLREWSQEWGLVAQSEGFSVPADVAERDHEWTWKPRKQADTLKAAMTLKTLLQAQAETREDYWRQNGRDPEKMKEAVLREQEDFAVDEAVSALAASDIIRYVTDDRE